MHRQRHNLGRNHFKKISKLRHFWPARRDQMSGAITMPPKPATVATA
ncbi:hypothetical protein XOCgx_0091 [Xanthomonas oryzae pv. oryzicola]|nr:hypothetical protein XOCgx_0091 [Xanthomonas oryzae pv. oryzicola]